MKFDSTAMKDLARMNSDQKQNYGDVNVSGSAKVHVGDSYIFNKDIFEAGTAKERETAILNILHFDGEDAKRNQLTLSGPVEESLEWIQKTSFMDWLHAPTAKPFWIQGKPASGKSTLMKHLSESKFTRDTINARGGGTWTIVYFFFDYRAGSTTANNTLGMMKYFMKQLGEKLSAVKNVAASLKTNDEENYLDVLTDTITKSNSRVCGFVDGLDEYEGDLWDLCLLLERVRTRTGMRMCLASRPEPAFEASYGKTGCPTITMQDHNAATIRTWLDYKVDRFKADHIFAHQLFTSDLLDKIVIRSQGVILWARLVMDEMIKSCHNNAIDTQDDLMKILASLPPDLEPLYERILNKTNVRYRAEVAWLLSMIDDVGGSYGRDRRSPVLLCQALNYLQIKYLSERNMLPSDLADNVYETRLGLLLGNLVDVERNSEAHKKKKEFPQVRLIHKSLSTYLERSCWITKNVPENAKHLCAKPVWRRVAIDMIQHLAPNQPLDSVALLKYAQDVRNVFYSDLRVIFDRVAKYEVLFSSKYRPWYAMITYLVSEFYSLGQSKGTDQEELSFPTPCEDFALLHYATCRQCEPVLYWGWFEKARAENTHRNGNIHLVLDLSHGQINRVVRALDDKKERSVMQDLYDLALLKASNTVSSANLSTLLQAFVEHEYYIEPRHICMVPALLRQWGGAGLLVKAAEKSPKHRALHIHDKNCPDRTKHVNFGNHWMTLNSVDDCSFLDFLTALDIDLDEAFRPEGGLYHGILNWASPKDKIRTDKALGRFMAAAIRGRAPDPKVLDHARKLRSKIKWEPLEINGFPVRGVDPFLNMTTEVYIKFLDWAIVGLRYYEKFGFWHKTWCHSLLVDPTKAMVAGPFGPMEAELGPDKQSVQAVKKPKKAEKIDKPEKVEEREKVKKRFGLTLRVKKKK